MSRFARRLQQSVPIISLPPIGTVGNGLSSDPNFFPLMVWLQTPEATAEDYKNIGINTFVGMWVGMNDSNLTALNDQGLICIADQNSAGLNHALGPSVMKGWAQTDEPDNAQDDGQGGWGPSVPVQDILDVYASNKAADPLDRPVYLNFGQAVGNPDWIGIGYDPADRETIYTDYSEGADIVAFDVYPVNSSLPFRTVSDGMDNLRRWTNYEKPAYFWVECTRYSEENGQPTPAQTKCQVWMALTHGANGIGYFCHIFTPTFIEAGLLSDSTMSAAVSAINAQITSLASGPITVTVDGTVIDGLDVTIIYMLMPTT